MNFKEQPVQLPVGESGAQRAWQVRRTFIFFNNKINKKLQII